MFKKCGLQLTISENARDEKGDRVYIYCDRAFFLEDGVIGASLARRNIPLIVEESIFNTYMAKPK